MKIKFDIDSEIIMMQLSDSWKFRYTFDSKVNAEKNSDGQQK